MSRKDCIDEIAEATNVSRKEAMDAAQIADDITENLKSKGSTDDLRGRVSRAVARKAEEAKIAAAQRRRHAALNAIARDALDNQINTLQGGGLNPVQTMQALFEGTQRSIQMGRVSVSNKQKALENKYLSVLFAKVRDRPAIKKMLEKRDPQFLRNTRKEWSELYEGGNPGVTRDADALFTARILADLTEMMRRDANKAGANIGKLDGWTGTQTHDPVKMARVEPSEWVDRIIPKLDLDRMFGEGTPIEDVRKVLDDVYLTLATGRSSEVDAAMKGDFKGPANMANALSRSRVLHFKTPELADQYNDEFGHGDILSGVFGSIEMMSRTVSMMETFGPNPKVMLDSVLSKMELQVRNSDMAPAKKNKMIGKLASGNFDVFYDIASGGLNNAAPGHGTAAEIGSSIRTVQAMAKLGGASITAMPTDTFTMIHASMNRGDGIVQATAKNLSALLSGLGSRERKHVAALVGEGFDGLIGNLTRGYAGIDGPVGRLSKISQAYFRYNLLNPWTDAARVAASSVIARDAGMNAGRAFDKLPERYRWVLEGHGIGSKEWDKIRATVWTGENGGKYITPDKIGDRDIEMAWRRFMADETNYGIVEMDAKSRRWQALNSTQRSGTVSGEVIRFMMQFKGFPLAFTERVFGRAVFGGRGQTKTERILRQAPHIGSLIAGLTAAGYVSLTAKDIVKGAWPPRDYMDPKTLIASLTQGGALGIYGDFLFTDSSSTRNSAAETAIGPTFGSVAQILNAGGRAWAGEGRLSDAVNIVTSNTPGYNLFYVRPAVDFLLVNGLREELSPGYMRRKERYRRKDYEQELLFNERLF